MAALRKQRKSFEGGADFDLVSFAILVNLLVPWGWLSLCKKMMGRAIQFCSLVFSVLEEIAPLGEMRNSWILVEY